MARTKQTAHRGYNKAVSPTRATTPGLPTGIIQQIADIALAHVALPVAAANGSGGSDTKAADDHLRMDSSAVAALRDYTDATLHRQLQHSALIAEHCRFTTVMGPFLITEPFLTSYWRDNGPRWLRGRHVTSNSILGSDQSNLLACKGGPLCPRRYDPDHIMIDSVWSWLLSIGMGRYASQLYAGARNWSHTNARTLINNLSAPEEHKQILHYHLGRLRHFISPLTTSQRRTGIDATTATTTNDHKHDHSTETKESATTTAAPAHVGRGRMPYHMRHQVDDKQRTEEEKKSRELAANITIPLGDLSYHDVFGKEKSAEDRLRELFQRDSTHSDLKEPWTHAVDIYHIPIDDVRTKVATVLPKTKEGSPFAVIHHGQSFQRASPVSIQQSWVKLAEFNVNWENLTHNRLFQPLSAGVTTSTGSDLVVDWKHIIVAGGAVLACLLPNFSQNDAIGTNGFANSDIDIFMWGLTPNECSRNLIALLYHINKSMGANGNGDILISPNSITILGIHPFRHIQIVLRSYQSPAQVLMGFDIDSCCVAFDGNRVYALPRAIRAMQYRLNCVDLSRRSLTYEHRLLKYAQRGFGIGVMGLDLSIVDWERLARAPHSYSGLPRLLIYLRKCISQVSHVATSQRAYTTNVLIRDPALPPLPPVVEDPKSKRHSIYGHRHKSTPPILPPHVVQETPRELKVHAITSASVASTSSASVASNKQARRTPSSSSNNKDDDSGGQWGNGADMDDKEDDATESAASSASDQKKRHAANREHSAVAAAASSPAGDAGAAGDKHSGDLPSVAQQLARTREDKELENVWQRSDVVGEDVYGDTSDYGWVPAFGLLTPLSIRALWTAGRTYYRLRDGGIVRLCKMHNLSSHVATSANHEYHGILQHESRVVSREYIADLQREGKGSVAISWLTHDPGRQLLTGSFHPLDDDQWEQRHEWQTGWTADDLSGRTLSSIMILLQRRYASMASHGLAELLPMIPRVILSLITSYFGSNDFTCMMDLLQYVTAPDCKPADDNSSGMLVKGMEAYLPRLWNGVADGIQLMTSSYSLPSHGQPSSLPLPLLTTGRIPPTKSRSDDAAHDEKAIMTEAAANAPLVQLAPLAPISSDAARMIQSILTFVLNDLTQLACRLTRRRRAGFVACRDVETAIKSLFSGHIANGMMKQGTAYLREAAAASPPPSGDKYSWRSRAATPPPSALRREINVSYIRTAMQAAIARHDTPSHQSKATIALRMGAPMYMTGVLFYLMDQLCSPPKCVTCDATYSGTTCISCTWNRPKKVVEPVDPSPYNRRRRRRSSEPEIDIDTTVPKPVLPCAPLISTVSAWDIWRQWHRHRSLYIYGLHRGVLISQPLARSSYTDYITWQLAQPASVPVQVYIPQVTETITNSDGTTSTVPVAAHDTKEEERVIAQHAGVQLVLEHAILGVQRDHITQLTNVITAAAARGSDRSYATTFARAIHDITMTTFLASIKHDDAKVKATSSSSDIDTHSGIVTATAESSQSDKPRQPWKEREAAGAKRRDAQLVRASRGYQLHGATATIASIKLHDNSARVSLNACVTSLVNDLLPGVLRLVHINAAPSTAAGVAGARRVITSGMVLSALALRSDHPWHGAQPVGFTPASNGFAGRMNEHDQLIALANRLYTATSGAVAPSVGQYEALPRIDKLESMIMDDLPTFQSTIERSCDSKSYEWQPSALQAFQMAIELALLPLVIAATRLAIHRTPSPSSAGASSSASLSSTTRAYTPDSVSLSSINGAHVVLTHGDINLAIRLCWTHRLPSLLRSSTQRIDISGIEIGAPLTKDERHYYLQTESRATRRRHYYGGRGKGGKMRKGKIDPAVAAAEAAAAALASGIVVPVPVARIAAHPIYNRYRTLYDKAAKSASLSYYRTEEVGQNRTTREGQAITHDIASYFGFGGGRQRLKVPYNIMYAHIDDMLAFHSVQQHSRFETSFIPLLSMMTETRVQHMSLIALECARHRLSSSSVASSSRDITITASDVQVAIMLIDIGSALTNGGDEAIENMY